MKNIFLTLISLFIITSCSKDNEDLNIVNETLNNQVVRANLDLESKLSSYKSLLNKNNTPFTSKESVTTLLSTLNIEANKQTSFYNKSAATILTKNQITHVAYLGSLLSNTESSEAAFKILKDDYELISNSNKFTEEEKFLLLVINNSIKISTELVVNEFNNSNKFASKAVYKSYWKSLTSAYADLTNDLTGQIALGVFPGPCVAAIIIGGTINYYRQ